MWDGGRYQRPDLDDWGAALADRLSDDLQAEQAVNVQNDPEEQFEKKDSYIYTTLTYKVY